MRLMLLLVCLLPLNMSAQQLDSCGLSNHTRLNAHEAAYFNKRFQETKGEFEFRDKRVIFITGESGNVLGSKRAYFDYVKKWQIDFGRDYIGGSSVHPFTEAQRVKSDGYDAIVTYWSKFHAPTDRIIERVIRKTRKHKYPLPD